MSLFGGDIKECRACREEISDEADVCPHCGEPQDGLKVSGGSLKDCRACGEEISTEADVCPNCGEPQDGFKAFGGSLKDCRACSGRISTDAEECPHCGEPQSGFKAFGGDLKECRACREEISTDVDSCPNCGEPQTGFKAFGGTLIECRTCHRDISDEADECPHCGEIYNENGDYDENDSNLSSDEETKSVYIGSRRSTDFDYNSGSSYESDYSTDYRSGDSGQSSPNNSLTGLITIVILLAAGWFIYKAIKGNEGGTYAETRQSAPVEYSQPTYNLPPVVEDQVSSNPFGEGNGRVSFYRTSILGDNTQIYFEENAIATINECPWSDATCGGQGTFSANVPAGIRLFIFKDEHGQMWKEYIDVPEFDCVLFQVICRNAYDENNDGLEDGLTVWIEEKIPEVIKNSSSSRSMNCPQCKGAGEWQLNAYCTACTRFGLGGVAMWNNIDCPDCSGSGMVDNSSCTRCGQTGKIECNNCSGKGRAPKMFKCNLCQGDGKIAL